MSNPTDRKRVRWSKEHVRALAWVAGSATFFTGVSVLGAAPRLVGHASSRATRPPAHVGQAKRYIFVVKPPAPPKVPTYTAPVYSSGGWAPSGGGTSTGGGTSSGGGHTTGGGAPPPPPPPPVCTTNASGITTCH